MKRAFFLYLTTGCRRSEVIEGTLDGKEYGIEVSPDGKVLEIEEEDEDVL